jgi:hypothetical protein
MAERGLVMTFHSLIIGIVVYAICMYMDIKQETSENRSIAIASAALLYMILFGHKMPYETNNSTNTIQ